MKKQSKLKKLILPLFIIFIMVFSIFGYFSDSNGNAEKKDYHGYKFVDSGQGWITYKGDKQIIIQTDPSILQYYQDINIKLDDLNSAEKIYLTLNPQESVYGAANILLNQLQSLTSTQIILACTEDVEECSNIPLKTCDDASQSVKIIQLRQSETQKMSYQNNCLLIEGDYQNSLIFIDKLVLTLNNI